jgi:uncharacterized repeat protein (TIGR01451 family)
VRNTVRKPKAWALVIVLAGGLFAGAAVPQVPTGTWAATGAMSHVRIGASAALLPDGTVLIAGGEDADGPSADAERYEIGTGAFSAAASMSLARSHHASVMLQDGRVLVTGGTTSGGGKTQTAELYDPASNAWSDADDMLEARSGHSASLLFDGRVLIAGGQTDAGVSSSLEIFDPFANRFASAGTLSEPRSAHASAVLKDGRVLVAGGYDGNAALSSVDIFDPATGTASRGPDLFRFRIGASATTLLDGKVLIAGGTGPQGDEATADIYDPATNTFSPTRSWMTTPRRNHLAVLLPYNNNVLIAGGIADGSDLGSAELYAPWNDAFSATGSMSIARAHATGSPVPVDGLFLVAGGSSATDAELYGFATLKTDKPDYTPGETVIITGSGWKPGETVSLLLQEIPRTHGDRTMTATADNSGNIFNNEFQPEAHHAGVRFYLTATGEVSQAQATFTDPPKIDLDQCRNGPATTPNDCVAGLGGGMGWANGNAGASQAHYIEGYSIPYRAVMTELPTATSITVVLGYDIKQGGKHAIDYLTHYQRLEPHAAAFGHPAETVTPTSGVTGVSPTTTTFPIPSPSSAGSPVPGQPTASFNSLPPNERVMTLFGGTITGVSYVSEGSLTASASETRISITFIVNSATAVLAWGGHIARASDWGNGNSASGISGSPYHMRLISWTQGNLGNQDRSLAAAAVFATGSVVINKVAQGGDDTFDYTATGSGIPSSFSITTTGGTGSQSFTDIRTGAKTVTESQPPSGWEFVSLVCDDPDGGTTTSGRTANIDLDANQTVTCTFTNRRQNAALTLDKTASPSSYDSVGDTINYSYELTNSGNVTLSGPFTVTDDRAAPICPPTATLAPSATITCTASYVITQLDLDAGKVTNTATGHGFFGTTVVDSNTDTETVTAVQEAALILDKTASPSTYDSVGDIIAYSYELTNSGNVTLTGPFTITDDKTLDEACPVTASLAPGASITCTAAYVITQLDLDAGSVTNTATGHGFFGTTIVDSNEDSETVTGEREAALILDKTASPTTYDSMGDIISYSYLLTNSGNVTLTGPFTITDDKTLNEACPVTATLAPGASITCTATYVITQLDLDAGLVTNVATGHGFFGTTIVDSNSDTETVTGEREAGLILDKTASPTTYDSMGDIISYGYLLTNSGNVTLTGPFTITDDKTLDEACPVTLSLAPGASITCTATYVITQLDLDAGSVTNVATGHGFFGINIVDSNSDTETVRSAAQPDPVVVLTMTAPPTAVPGSLLPYRLEYANVGPAPSQSARIVDYLPAGVTFVSASNGGTYNPVTRTVTWNLGTVPIAKGAVDLVVRVPLTVPPGSVLVNRAEFTGLATVSPPTAAAVTSVVPH